MPSPKASRSAGRSGGSPVLGSSNGRYEFMSLNRAPPPHLLQRQGSDPATARLRASESPTRRRGSGSSTGSTGGQGLPEEDSIRLNPSIIGVALSSLLAIDLWLSKRLGVCACEDSSWGSIRPLMKLIEISGHGIPWLAGTAYCLYKSDSAAGQEVMLNLFLCFWIWSWLALSRQWYVGAGQPITEWTCLPRSLWTGTPSPLATPPALPCVGASCWHTWSWLPPCGCWFCCGPAWWA
ncbi:polyisoprenoid diphosphate/phosphate phosphohydrolase PLPP6 isoform X2 [Myripristis murdjan]|uniref:polyisoprenoid diphosphate/phosphate phosphohydrolase PLPP6 isoform X2 n=1 Tax=Myripristis murdjan TaxID=586833 RepID=UPI0011764265|nr:phospholipid phosphatase 6-like isoform X2 [Myripristis murdjan]